MTFECAVSFLVLVAAGCMAQDVPLKKPEIFSMHITSDISYRYATTKVTSRIKNPSDKSREALFDVTLPNEAFITNLTIEIDGNITVGEIKEKEEAKAQYEAAKSRGESAGYVGTKHRETNKFVLAITVAPLSKISFNLTYQELLRRKLGFYEQVIFIDPGQPVEDMSVTVSIRESRNITRLSVPSLRNDVGEAVLAVDGVVVIDRTTEKSAIIKYAPSIREQKLQSEVGIAGMFVVQYDVDRANDIGDVLMVNGYFVHFFAPEGLTPVPNDVLFILDVSGSMQGKKMEQLIEAMLSNLNQLSPNDRFNMMTFSNEAKLWREKMANVNDEDAMENAKSFVRDLKADGWTNINQALGDGILSLKVEQLSRDTETRSPLIVFLTDGEPTNGITDTATILRNVQVANEGGIPVFTLAFGANADWDFVKKLALQNDGFGRKIYEASDAAMQIMGFYNEIAVTLLSNITFNYLDVEESNVTKSRFSNYFNGSEIVICGYLPDEQMELNATVSARSASGAPKVILSGIIDQMDMDVGGGLGPDENMTLPGDYEAITEKMWAYLTIKQLLEKADATDSSKDRKKYEQEVLKLSLQYGFVTPLTSMVVTQALEGGQPDPIMNVEVSDDTGIMPKASHLAYSTGNMMQGYSLGGVMHSQHRKYLLPTPGLSPHIASYGRRHQAKPNSRRPVGKKSSRRRQPSIRPAGMHSAPDVDADANAGKQRVIASNTRRDNPKKRKYKKKKNGKNGARFPLLVNYDGVRHSVCYTLYEKTMANASYSLYTSPEKDVNVTVMVSTSASKKIGMIRTITVQSPDLTSTINGITIKQHLLVTSGYYNIRNDPGSEVTIEIGNLTLDASYSKLYNEFYIIVRKAPATLEDDYLLGSVLSKDVQEKGLYQKKGKPLQKLEIGGHHLNAKLKRLANEIVPGGKCYSITRKESKVYNMADFRV